MAHTRLLLRSIVIAFVFFPLASLADIELVQQDSVTTQQVPPNIDNYLPLYLQPVTLTPEGIEKFYLYLNHPLYSERFLPQCFLHVVDLLSYTPKQENPLEYIRTFVSIFQQKIKQCSWINPYALLDLLEKIPSVVGTTLTSTNLESFEEILHEYFYEKITKNQEAFVQNPREFSRELAQDVSSYLDENIQRYATRVLITRFVENCIDKVIWSPQDAEYTWKTCKLLGHHIEKLYSYDIIPDIETAHQLLWSLVTRFCYFLDLSAPMLPIKLYQDVSQDITDRRVSWLNQPEIDEHLEPKATFLQHAVDKGKTRALLYLKHDQIT